MLNKRGEEDEVFAFLVQQRPLLEAAAHGSRTVNQLIDAVQVLQPEPEAADKPALRGV